MRNFPFDGAEDFVSISEFRLVFLVYAAVIYLCIVSYTVSYFFLDCTTCPRHCLASPFSSLHSATCLTPQILGRVCCPSSSFTTHLTPLYIRPSSVFQFASLLYR